MSADVRCEVRTIRVWGEIFGTRGASEQSGVHDACFVNSVVSPSVKAHDLLNPQ